MTATKPDGDRNIIPRWRDPLATAQQGELGPVSRPSVQDGYAPDFRVLEEAEQAWNTNGTLAFAMDLVGSASVIGSSPSAREAAQFVLERSNRVSPLAVAISQRLLGIEADRPRELLSGQVTGELRNEVAQIRSQLTADPRRTLLWTELSRHFTILGQAEKADRAMRVALALSPDHRYVLRAATRLAIHNGDYSKAHSIIGSAGSTPFDPWLIATEIAAAEVAGRRSRMARRGEQMLDSGNFLPLATTELASALGTLELRAGNRRRARRLFERALTTPNENSIAQSEWASHRISSIRLSEDQMEGSAEARARSSSEEGEWGEAVEAARDWLRDQPFSSGPAALGSYEASVGQDFATGAELARLGLRANPDEFLLRNNFVFCLVHLGQLDYAVAEWNRVREGDLNQEEKPTYYATSGLLAFRSGRPEDGSQLYGHAIQLLKDRRKRAIATILFARELILSRLPGAAETARLAQEISGKVDHPDIALWLDHLPKQSQTI